MTRMPEAFSRTTRTILSTDRCRPSNRGMDRRDTRYTMHKITGSIQVSTNASTGSRVMVTATPPTTRMGARMPMRCIMPTIR